MVAPVMSAVGKVGRTAHAVNGTPPEAMDENAPPQRHKESAVVHGAERMGDYAGEQLFAASFMAGAGGWLFRNTIGRVNKAWGAGIGRFTVAPFEALDSTSLAGLLENPKSIAANYYHHAAKYVGEHGGNASGLLQKAEALGGANIAKAEWQGLKGLPKYLMHRPLFSTVMAGGLALGGGIAALRTGAHAKDGITDLEEVAQDLIGHRIPLGDIVNHPEKLPPIIKDMRDNLMDVLKVDSAGAFGTMIEKGAFAAMGGPLQHAGNMFGLPMAGMMGGMMLGQAAEGFMPQHHFLKSYLTIKDRQSAGQTVPVEDYLELMAAASKEVRRIGGATSEQVQRIAQQYADEQLSAKDVVEEIFNHEPFKERALAVAKEMEAEQAEEEKLTPESAKEKESEGAPEFVKKGAANENSEEVTNEFQRKLVETRKPGTTVAKEQVQLDGKIAASAQVARGGM